MLRQRRLYLLLIPAGLLIALAVFLLTRPRGQTPDAATTGEMVTAFIGDLAANASASGSVQARRQATLSVGAPGVVKAVYVRVGESVTAGDVLLEMDSADLSLAVANAELNVRLRAVDLAALSEAAEATDIAAAQAAVVSAQANLDDLLAGPSEAERAAGEAGVRAATASLNAASADLAKAQSGVSQAQLQAAQGDLLAAQANLRRAEEINAANPTYETDRTLQQARQAVANAQAQLDALTAAPDVSASQSSVTAARARLDSSQAELDQLLIGASEAQIAAARQQLAQAQANLATLQIGPTEAQVAAATAQLEQARLTLADAQAQLEAATLRAPFAGMITAVNVQPGESAAGPAVTMLDATDLEVVLSVDEVDVGLLAVGQSAEITLETWPDAPFESAISLIAPDGVTDPSSSLVTYQVHLNLPPTDQPVRAGMSASARLITAQREDVLLVPNSAINVDRAAGTYSVNLVTPTGVQVTPVTLGLRDDNYTQITAGLSAGDQLLINNGAPLQSIGPGSGSGRGPFGGNN